MQNVKAAEGVGGHQATIQIADWRPYLKGSLLGFFSASLVSGMTLHHLMLHQKNGVRWVGFPAREWTNDQGVKQYSKFIEFTNRATADRFRAAILAALDAYLEAQPCRS